MITVMWQDYVITIGLVVFCLSLIPAIRAEHKPPLMTSMPTAFFQYVFLVTFASLELWLSAVGASVLAVLWTTLAVQKYRQRG